MSDPLSLKDRTEQTLVNLLNTDETLAKLDIAKQNEQIKPQRPYIAIIASPAKEISPGAGVFRIPVAIEMNWNAKQPNQDADSLDQTAQKVHDIIAARQAIGTFGLVRESESQAFEGETGRKRTINLTVFAS